MAVLVRCDRFVNEVLVGQTQYSYTYARPPRKDKLYNLAHGTLAAEALTPVTTRLTYTMLRDDSMLPEDAARRRDEEARCARVSEGLKNMKVLAAAGRCLAAEAGGNLPFALRDDAPQHEKAHRGRHSDARRNLARCLPPPLRDDMRG